MKRRKVICFCFVKLYVRHGLLAPAKTWVKYYFASIPDLADIICAKRDRGPFKVTSRYLLFMRHSFLQPLRQRCRQLIFYHWCLHRFLNEYRQTDFSHFIQNPTKAYACLTASSTACHSIQWKKSTLFVRRRRRKETEGEFFVEQ